MAKVATAQRAKKIQDSLQDAMAHGMDFKTWKKTNKGILQRIPKAHLQTTYRNWTQTSYVASRVNYLSQPAVMKRRPYWVFDAVIDGATTPVCTAYNGTVLPAGHSWFYSRMPPLHHNCRSTIRGLTNAQATKLGKNGRAPHDNLTKKKLREEGAEDKFEPGTVAPQSGFGSHVLEPWQPTSKQLPSGAKRKLKRPDPVDTDKESALVKSRKAAASAAAAQAKKDAAENLKKVAAAKPPSAMEGAIKSKRSLGGGINSSSLVTFEDGKKGVWKPVSGEDKSMLGGAYDELAKREEAAYKLDRLLGTNVVPETVVRKVGTKRGSMQLFVDDATATISAERRHIRESVGNDAKSVTLFDVISGNTDRHEGNLMIVERAGKQRLLAIDNGFAFPGTRANETRHMYLAGRASEYVSKGELVDFAGQQKLLKKLNRKELVRQMRESKLSDAAINDTVGKSIVLRDDPKLLKRRHDALPEGASFEASVAEWSNGGGWQEDASEAQMRELREAMK
jgi:SPP1 gp7 family putative phage head morphogenesis protein